MIGSVFDFFDGFIARKLNLQSEFGKQLDSLADLVTFGTAPSIIVYCTLNNYISEELFYWPIILLSLIIQLFSALRLAKYNIDSRQDIEFLGLPSPANAPISMDFALSSIR